MGDLMKYKDMLKNATNKLIKNNKEESVAIFLLEYMLNQTSSQTYALLEESVDLKLQIEFEELLNKHIVDNIPVQYITNKSYFYGYDLFVNEDVLIPRFETEELVEQILYRYDKYFLDQKIDVCDVATGSGCIGLTLAKEESNINMTITDISEKALEVAKKNKHILDVDAKILCGDMLKPLEGSKFDILISNPPYIPDSEDVMSLVKDNEPNIALFGGVDGLKFYRIILSECKDLLKDKFIIAFEHAYDKGLEIRQLAKDNFPSAKIETLKDMQGKDRMTFVVGGFDE